MNKNDEVIKCLKACILSRKGGVPFNELNSDYKELVGSDVPVKSLGFASLGELLRSVPGFLVDQRAGIVQTQPNEQTKHLHILINNQKDGKNKRYKPRTEFKKSYRPSEHQYKTRNWNVEQNQHPARKITQPAQKKSLLSDRTNNYKKRNISIHKQNYYQRNQYDNNYSQTNYFQNSSHQNDYYGSDHSQNYYNPCSNPSYYNYQFHYQYESDEVGMYNSRSYSSSYNHFGDFYDFSEDKENCNYYRPNERYSYRNGGCISGYTVIGDDHMLDLLGCSPSALCDSGMTLKRALLAVRKYGCSDKVVIALGTVDVLRGLTDTELMLDMNELIQTVANTGASVAVCTIPPIPSVKYNVRAINTINEFNKWLSHTDDRITSVIDVNRVFKSGRQVLFEFFKRTPKLPLLPGCFSHFVSWNKMGKSLVEKEIKRALLKIRMHG